MFEDGDYVIMRVPAQDEKVPEGALLPIPNVPQFENTSKALAWIRGGDGHVLAGMKVVVIKIHRMLELQAAKRVVMEIIEAPRHASEPPERE